MIYQCFQCLTTFDKIYQMSNLFKRQQQTRISIFQDWNIVAPVMKLAKDILMDQNKPEQIRRAQQLLNDAELIYCNIHEFLQQKYQLTYRSQIHRQHMEKLLQQIYDLNSNRSQNINEQDNIVSRMREILQEIYRQLRLGRVLERHIGQFFQSANLANYNPNIHQLRFANNTETEHIIKEKIQQIRKACRSLFRSIHYQQKLAAVFSKDQNINFCYQTLNELISHDSMVRIHANMICQLKEIDDVKKELIVSNRAGEAEYAKYELIYDCLELMKSEKQQIERQKSLLEENNFKAAHYVPVGMGFHSQKSRLGIEESVLHYTMSQGLQSQGHIENNLRVYRTNLQNFTRVSAQTSLYCYAYRHAQFTEALTSFEQFFEKWKKNHSHLSFLYEQRKALQNIKQQSSVKGGYNEPNRQNLLAIYQQIINTAIPKDQALESYKRNLLTDYERELQAQRINFDQRQIRKQDAKSILNNLSDFFERLKNVDTRQKIRFLRVNRQTLDQLTLELQQLQLHNNQNIPYHTAIDQYASALDFAKIISNNDHFQAQLDQFNDSLIAGRSYRQLPHGMTDLVLAYVHDLNIIIRSQQTLQNFGGNHMEYFLDSVEATLREKKKVKLDEAVESNFYLLTDSWIHLHASYFRHLSPIGEELMLDKMLQLVQSFSSQLHQRISNVTEIPEILARSMDIDRSFFYTYRVLLALDEMTIQGQQADIERFRITNLEAVLQRTFEQLDTFFLNKKPSFKGSDYIKLTLLEVFFGRVYKGQEYARMIRTIRLQVYLQFIAQIYIENFESEYIRSNWLQPLLAIHFRMYSVPSRANALKDRTLAQQSTVLLQTIRKYPLTFTNKHQVSSFQNALRARQLLDDLRQYPIEAQTIDEAARSRVALQAVSQAQIMVVTRFDEHENVMIKQRKSASISFEEIRRNIEKDIEGVQDIEPLQRHFQDCQASVSLSEGTRQLIGR